MKKIFYSVICALFLFGCSNDEKTDDSDSGSASVPEMSNVVFRLSDGMLDPMGRAVAGGANNPLDPADILKYIKNVRLLVFDTDQKLVHQASWTETKGVFKTCFRMVGGQEYEYIIVTNSDIAGCFTADLINNVSTKGDIMMMLKRVVDAKAPAGNGDTGCRYQFYTRSVAPTDINHIFYGLTRKAFAASPGDHVVDISIKRVMAMVNFSVKIENPVFQAALPAAPEFLNQLTFDVSRMACALDLGLTQKLKSQSNYDDCVVRGGAFTNKSESDHVYSSTAFVFGNGKDAFLSFNIKTQKADGGLLANKDRIFWIDLANTPIERNKKYNITTTIPVGNFGGDPNDPTTVNPENPYPGTCGLVVDITVEDWDATSVEGGGDLH